MFFNKKYNSIYGKCLRKLLEANNEIFVVTKLLHSFIHSFNFIFIFIFIFISFSFRFISFHFTHSFIHSFIRSIMTRLLMNYGKPILLKMTKRE